jgi:hypothetical protein
MTPLRFALLRRLMTRFFSFCASAFAAGPAMALGGRREG